MSDAIETSHLPPYLRALAELTKFHRRAGEWDLALADDVRVNPSDYLFDMHHVLPMAQAFFAAFPWVSATSARMVYRQGADYVERVWNPSDQVLDEWPAMFNEQVEWVSELEIACSGRVDCTLHDSTQGQVEFPNFGRLKLYAEDKLWITWTIWPNLFTDTIEIYPEDWTVGTEAQALPFQPAAARNRQQLGASLRAWEHSSGGAIVSWSSDLVEGVERYGFAADAAPN